MAKRLAYSRSDLRQFWRRATARPIRLLARPHRVVLNFLKDAQLFFLFLRDWPRA